MTQTAKPLSRLCPRQHQRPDTRCSAWAVACRSNALRRRVRAMRMASAWATYCHTRRLVVLAAQAPTFHTTGYAARQQAAYSIRANFAPRCPTCDDLRDVAERILWDGGHKYERSKTHSFWLISHRS